ncbi:hypothetical protein MBLNU459_g3833t1 [Dothideomycetes sp. NU459]
MASDIRKPKLGWTGSGNSLDALETLTWFRYHGEAAENVRSILSESLVAFLERALIIKNDDHGSLFFYVHGLVQPGRLRETFEWREEEEAEPRYVTLYGANSMASHPDGLAFDMKTSTAIMQMSIHDADITLNGRIPWYPLEVVLSSWLDMVDVGKIKAVGQEVEGVEKFDPWICLHSNDFQVEETVNAFDLLVESVEIRMREQGLPISPHTTSLLSEPTLNAAGIPAGFARSFLIKARLPQFRYIAPGLAMPDDDTFVEQPFASIGAHSENAENENAITIKPIILFRSARTFVVTDEEDYDIDPFFTSPFSDLHSFPAGVYLKDSQRQLGHEFEDGVRFVSPFGVGGNGFARTSDGLQIEDPQDSEDADCGDRHGDLYQQGWNPFIEMHPVRLIKVLESWTKMVQRGHWKIGAEGVEGTIDAFKEADTEQAWEEFIVPVSW